MCRACSTHEKKERSIQGLGGGNMKEETHLKGPGVDGRLILKWILKKWDGNMDWIDLVQDRDGWRAVVNAVMNLRVP